MRIGIVYARYAVGGIERNIRSSGMALEKRGHDVHVIVPNGIFRPSELVEQQEPTAFSKYALPQARAVPRAYKAAKAAGLDIIHFHGYWPYPYTNGLFRLRRKLAPKSVWTPHVDFATRRAAIARMGRAERLLLTHYHDTTGPRMLRQCDLVVALSEREQADYRRLGVRNVIVIPNGVESLPPTVERDWTSPTLRLVTTGRIGEGKGVDVLLDAARRVAELGISFELAIVGPFESERWRDLIETKASAVKEPGRVRILGKLGDAELLAELARSHVYIMPSSMDTQPVRLIEAMAEGLPSVAASVGVVGDLIADTGILVEAGNAESIAGAIAGLAANRPLLATLSSRAYTRREEFSWKRLAETLEAGYRGTTA